MSPRAVAMLAGVIDDICRYHNLAHGADEAKEIALRTLALFNAGIEEEDDLRAIMNSHSTEPGRPGRND